MADCSVHSVPTHLTHGPNHRDVITESTESGETVDWLKPFACLKKGWNPEIETYVELSFVTGIIICIYFFYMGSGLKHMLYQKYLKKEGIGLTTHKCP